MYIMYVYMYMYGFMYVSMYVCVRVKGLKNLGDLKHMYTLYVCAYVCLFMFVWEGVCVCLWEKGGSYIGIIVSNPVGKSFWSYLIIPHTLVYIVRYS